VLGTGQVARAAQACGSAKLVLISTDKAVNPTNVMGATKRVAELLCLWMDRPGGTRFTTVRFGNVLDSAGSVVPLFRRQLEKGGPVTVTDPEIERFFMTIPEACQLIMQAAVIGDGGEIFVLDMGEPVKIRYLAEQMIRLSGKRPGEDVAIEYIGLRPGEKLYEELFYASEDLLPTVHPKIKVARRGVGLPSWSPGDVLAELEGAVREPDEERLARTLAALMDPDAISHATPPSSSAISEPTHG
jgi:FlaA1/EpsC-like NDP-sugar epimerase